MDATASSHPGSPWARRLALLLLAVLLIVVGLAAAKRVQQRLQPLPPPPEVPIAVHTEVLAPAPFTLSREYVGTVQASERITLAAQLTARVTEIPYREGVRVDAGTVLVRLDDGELAQEIGRLQASGARIEADLTFWREQLSRDEDLLRKGTVSQRSRDESQRNVASLSAAQAENREALAIARTRRDYAALRAPFAGVIQQVHALPGELATVGNSLLELVDTHTLKAVVSVPEADLAALRPGLPAHLTVAGRDLAATVDRIYPALDPLTRSASVELRLLRDGDGLRPGMQVQALVTLARHETALTLPRQALRRGAEGMGVFIAEDGAARWRPVEAGAAGADRILIEAGLYAGERVILTPDPRLEDGCPIAVQGAP